MAYNLPLKYKTSAHAVEDMVNIMIDLSLQKCLCNRGHTLILTWK